MAGELKSLCIKSKQDGMIHNVKQADLIKTGIPNDVHCDGGDKQISILPYELIEEYEKENGNGKVEYGKHGENLVVSGIDYKSLKVGDDFNIGDARLLVTQIGATYATKEGSPCNSKIHKNYIFCRVVVPGIITVGDQVNID